MAGLGAKPIFPCQPDQGNPLRVLLLILILLVQIALPAVAGLNADGTLDRAKISKAYFEGEFDLVVEALETFRKLQPNPVREDKIYAYKYLSVIYAAKPETRGKAESYMYQLLKIMPSIEIMDLYISDNIESIFNNVRMRFEHQQRVGLDSGQGSASMPASVPPSASAGPRMTGSARGTSAGNSPSAGKGSASWVWWTAGAAGVAVAVTGYILLSESSGEAAETPETVDLK